MLINFYYAPHSDNIHKKKSVVQCRLICDLEVLDYLKLIKLIEQSPRIARERFKALSLISFLKLSRFQESQVS